MIINAYSRRTFLRGLGACIALPAFESLRVARAAAPAAEAPLRTAFLFFPNGAIPESWWPAKTGTDFDFSRTLAPLEPFRDSLQILKGLDNRVADAGSDGGGDHARGNGTFLTGVRINKSDTNIRAGISIDQCIANRVGQLTRFRSLELASDPNRQTTGCDSGYSCAYQYNISWKSEKSPVATENNPRLVFERLFGVGAPGERNRYLEQRRSEQRSILDFVLNDVQSFQKQLQKSDQLKLDEYISGVRELESRIQRVESLGDAPDPATETPIGIPQSHEEYVSLMYELSALAFQTDSTRVLTLMLGHDGDNRSFDFIDISEGHHDLTHHQNKEDRIAKVMEIDRWYVQQFSKFLKRLDQTMDVDGKSILHNSMILFGSGNADGNRHSHTDLPIVLAGGGGGQLTTGRSVDHQGKPLTNLFLSMAEKMGVNDLDRFGDSTGKLLDL